MQFCLSGGSNINAPPEDIRGVEFNIGLVRKVAQGLPMCIRTRTLLKLPRRMGDSARFDMALGGPCEVVFNVISGDGRQAPLLVGFRLWLPMVERGMGHGSLNEVRHAERRASH